MAKPTPKELCDETGISPSYASMILNGEGPTKRTPPRPFAIHIYRKFDWRHESIANLTEEDMQTFERHDPYQPRDQAKAA